MEMGEQARIEILQNRSRQSFENVIIPAVIGGITGIITQFLIDGDILSTLGARTLTFLQYGICTLP